MTENFINNTNEETPIVSTTNLTVDKIFDQITTLISQMDHVTQAMEIIEKMPTELNDHGSRGQAIGNIVHAREETNRKALSLLEKMYDDLNPANLSAEEKAEREAKRDSKKMRRDTIRDLIIHNRDENLIREFYNEL